MKKLVALLTIAYVTVAVIDPASTALIPDLAGHLGAGHGLDRTTSHGGLADAAECHRDVTLGGREGGDQG